ncbi:MAG: Uncharacterised protein [Opitutia bacterium UBA7350]|nr:MAG: Uncharacterised protein [Opitutae bacterium UBA7350]
MKQIRWRRLGLLVLIMSLQLSLWSSTQEVQLKSGERLLGEILATSNDDMLHLRSKILGDLKLPRSAIASTKDFPAVKPKLVSTVAQPKPKPAAVAKRLTTSSASEAKKPWRMIESIKDFKTPPSWKGNLRLGLNITNGNSKWTERYARGQLSILPKGSKNFYRFGGAYSFRENEYNNGTSRVTNNKFDLSALYRRSFSKGWFMQNALGYRSDEVKGINHEIKLSVGAGYKFKIYKDKIELNVGSGLGVEDFEASKANDLRSGRNYIGNIFQELTWKMSKRTTFSQKFNYFQNVKEHHLYDFKFTTAFRSRLTDVFGLEFSYQKDFDSEVDGKEKDDIQWRSALVIYF